MTAPYPSTILFLWHMWNDWCMHSLSFLVAISLLSLPLLLPLSLSLVSHKAVCSGAVLPLYRTESSRVLLDIQPCRYPLAHSALSTTHQRRFSTPTSELSSMTADSFFSGQDFPLINHKPLNLPSLLGQSHSAFLLTYRPRLPRISHVTLRPTSWVTHAMFFFQSHTSCYPVPALLQPVRMFFLTCPLFPDLSNLLGILTESPTFSFDNKFFLRRVDTLHLI